MKINLLSNVPVSGLGRVVKIEKTNRRVLTFAVVIFLIFVLTVGGVFLYFNFRLGTTKNELSSLERSYSSRASEVVTYIRSKQSIDEIDKILSGRNQYRQRLEDVYDTLPNGVYLSGVDFSSDGVLSFSGKADGIDAYENFIQDLNLSTQSNSFAFSEVVQTELVRQRNGNYRFIIDLRMKNG
jgi:hypothetical protein